MAEPVREFRQARLLKIMSGDTASQMESSASLVLHVVPLPSFGDRRLINVAEVLSARPVTMHNPTRQSGFRPCYEPRRCFRLFWSFCGPVAWLWNFVSQGWFDRGCQTADTVDNNKPYIAGEVF